MINEYLKNYKKYPVTIALMTVCVVVYIVSCLLYGLEMNANDGIAFGGFNPLYVLYENEYYRLITANFIHFGILHIAVNCYSLFGIGSFIERVLKTKKYIIVLIASALATTGLPFLLFLINGYGSMTISGGISGVIFGLIGALGALALTYKDVFLDVFKQLLPNVLLMLFISIAIPSISLSGHVSGLIGGFIATYIVLKIKVKPKKNKYEDLLN
ncbi:MAG: rhomboid family intramembrane serine protease [Coprobacillus sp.]